MKRIKAYFLARSNPKDTTIVSLSVLLVTTSILVVAQQLFSGHFSFTEVYVSSLGNPSLNPRGWMFFTLSFIVGTIGESPLYYNLYHRLKVIFPTFSKMWFVFSALGLIGSLGVGFFNELMVIPHITFTMMAFGGIYCAILISIVMMFYAYFHPDQMPWLNKPLFAVLLIGYVVLTGFVLEQLGIYGVLQPEKLILTEWASFTLGVLWHPIFNLMIPERK